MQLGHWPTSILDGERRLGERSRSGISTDPIRGVFIANDITLGRVAMKRLFLILSLLLPVTLLVSSASFAANKLEASIFSYDGKDFVRTETTLMQAGQSAVGTKLDHDSPAYKALAEKHSYTGPATVFGQNYQANYAPLISGDGKLTGAIFVAIPK
jgi:hypothetical protein